MNSVDPGTNADAAAFKSLLVVPRDFVSLLRAEQTTAILFVTRWFGMMVEVMERMNLLMLVPPNFWTIQGLEGL